MTLDKFIPPFITFVTKHFDKMDHHFAILGEERYEYGLTPEAPVEFINSHKRLSDLLISSPKIIIHGLWSETVNELLFLKPSLIQKAIWIMWGGDFYFPERHSKYKHFVIQNMPYYVASADHISEYLKNNYGAKGTFFPSFSYTTNIFQEMPDTPQVNSSKTTIQVGNSADPTNNYSEVFEILKTYKNKNIVIKVPLSYGDSQTKVMVPEIGKSIFGDIFFPMENLLPYNDYIAHLSSIDIAIFNHNRQQAMGNIISLLGLGKKVYIGFKPTRDFLKEKGITVFSLNEFSLTPLSESIVKENQKRVREYYSEKNLAKLYTELFNR